MAACDVDRNRLEDGKKLIDGFYAKKMGNDKYMDTKMYDDYREMLLNKDIDAVMISTPDHWHSQPAMEAALAGKHVYLQKPTSLTIAEGRQLAHIVNKTGVGSKRQNRKITYCKNWPTRRPIRPISTHYACSKRF
jgi:predicted dehydrogenase